MKVQCIVMNMFQENCYVAYDETRKAVIIDPGCYYKEEQDTLRRFIQTEQLTVTHLINTHLHVDHVFGNSFVEKEYGIRTEAHDGDLNWLLEMPQRCAMLGIPWKGETPSQLGKILGEKDTLTFGNSSFRTIHVPGHSQGSLCFYSEPDQVLFSGDVLFREGVGRADLPGGDWNALLTHIKAKLFSLPDETKVYPGHGPATTIGWEKKHNPYL